MSTRLPIGSVVPDRRSAPRGSTFPSVYAGLSPLAAELLRANAAQADLAAHAARERQRFEVRLKAARAGLARNPSWGDAVLQAGAL